MKRTFLDAQYMLHTYTQWHPGNDNKFKIQTNYRNSYEIDKIAAENIRNISKKNCLMLNLLLNNCQRLNIGRFSSEYLSEWLRLFGIFKVHFYFRLGSRLLHSLWKMIPMSKWRCDPSIIKRLDLNEKSDSISCPSNFAPNDACKEIDEEKKLQGVQIKKMCSQTELRAGRHRNVMTMRQFLSNPWGNHRLTPNNNIEYTALFLNENWPKWAEWNFIQNSIHNNNKMRLPSHDWYTHTP